MRDFARSVATMALVLISTSTIAQTTSPEPLVSPRTAVVSGFSGALSIGQQSPDPRRPAADLLFIDVDGASARIFDLGAPGAPMDGRLVAVPKRFEVLAKDVGQVFGVALDDQQAPNIYLGATSLFGLNLVARGRDGRIERRTTGGPGIGWMQGQFGLALQGDPGSIYRIDGRTGAPTLFARVMLNGVPNPGPGLGALAYDPAHKQLFASDLYTGMIHRFAIADGAEQGTPFDHGVAGRTAAQLTPVTFDPSKRPNIASNQFNAENPATWGFAPPERRVWALALREGRLFYSVRNGSASEPPQIWSIGVATDGSFAGDPRLEVDLPAQPGPYPVSDIAFTPRGAMFVAQRAPIAASYDFSKFTAAGAPRVLRFSAKDANDPPSPGLWKPAPEEYAVGFAGDYRNSDGGVALGYGYDRDGRLDIGACASSLLVTGDRLRLKPALRERLEPGGAMHVDGVQISLADGVLNPSAPEPWASYFVDYDNRFDMPAWSGHVGIVRTMQQPCAAPAGVASASGTPPYASGGGGNPPYVSGPGGGTDSPPPPPPPPPPPLPPYDLSIKKTAGEAKFEPATGTWTVTFTIVVTNNATPFSPGNSIGINDPTPAGLTLASATGAGWTCGGSVNCSFAFGSGVFATGATLPPLTITLTGKMPGSYTNCASVGAAGLNETTLANNKDCATVVFKYPPNRIRIEKVNLDPSCTVELLCRFQIKVINLDPWPFTGPVTISDNTTVGMNIAFTDVPCTPAPTQIPFSCTTGPLTIPASGTLTFSVNGVIPGGSVPVTGVHPDPINCAELSNPPAGTTITVPKDCKPYQVPCGFACHMTDSQIAQIKIDKKANQTTCSPGGLCSYTFTITNVSNTTATQVMPITFIDTMPAGAANYVSATPPPWGCVPFGAGQIKCLHPPGSLPPGGQLTITVTFQIAPGYNQPTLQNCGEFFVGQGAAAALKRREAAASMDAQALRDYLVSRGLAAMPTSGVTLQPDDKSCTTVNIAAAAGKKAPVVTPPVVTPPVVTPPVVVPPVCPPGTTRVGRECVKETVCKPPMVQGAAGVCGCPPGTALRNGECLRVQACRPPMQQNAEGNCACPTGLTQRGQRCVRPLFCSPPFVANAAGSACVCSPGTVRRGRACVVPPPPPVCNPPAQLRRGVCQCPPGMRAVGQACIPRDRRPPRDEPGPRRGGPDINPGDVIRVIPRIFPNGGGEQGGPADPRGGGKPMR